MKLNKLTKSLFTPRTLEKDKILLSIRWLIMLLVFMWWWTTSTNAIGIALILVLSSTTLIRMQFTNSFILILIDEFVSYISIVYWPNAIFALMLPSFEAGISGALLWASPILLITVFKAKGSNFLIILMLEIMTFSIGYIIKAWSEREIIYLKAADRERKQRYEVEQLKNELLFASNEVARLVETSERNRIAQQLHDNVGHEIAGALIALQTYKKLEENGDERSKEVLESVLKRIESSSLKLRETVYGLKPLMEGGAARLQKLCEEFSFCQINYRFIGDTNRVPAMIWVILEPCLKEALTNITKYSKATEVEVRLDITEYIIRMNIRDNGVGTKAFDSGLGLYGIRERVRAAGGTVSIESTNGFMITCILPIDIY